MKISIIPPTHPLLHLSPQGLHRGQLSPKQVPQVRMVAIRGASPHAAGLRLVGYVDIEREVSVEGVGQPTQLADLFLQEMLELWKQWTFVLLLHCWKSHYIHIFMRL